MLLSGNQVATQLSKQISMMSFDLLCTKFEIQIPSNNNYQYNYSTTVILSKQMLKKKPFKSMPSDGFDSTIDIIFYTSEKF